MILQDILENLIRPLCVRGMDIDLLCISPYSFQYLLIDQSFFLIQLLVVEFLLHLILRDHHLLEGYLLRLRKFSFYFPHNLRFQADSIRNTDHRYCKTEHTDGHCYRMYTTPFFPFSLHVNSLTYDTRNSSVLGTLVSYYMHFPQNIQYQ